MRAFLLLIATCVFAPPGALAQEPALPAGSGSETSRIFGVLPNFNTVESPESTYAPVAPDAKLRLAARNAFDPIVYPAIAVIAALTPRYGGGLEGYARQYGASLSDAALGSMFTAGLMPALLHQDPRYFRRGTGGFGNRSAYAITRPFVTKNDTGRPGVNWSELSGYAVTAGLSNTYYPPQKATVSGTASRWATLLLFDMLSYELKEFWPDIRRKLKEH